MAKIDTAGTYRGTVVEHGLGTTKKGYPQVVARFKATEKFIEEKADLDHFVGQGTITDTTPQWVDWTPFDEEIVAFLVLFNDADVFDENSQLMNYEQLQLAFGWDGTEFETLNNNTYVDKTVLFRIEEDEYDGKVQLKVNWVDDPEASPTRELKKLDDSKLKDLSGKLKVSKSKPAKPAAPAKPGAASKPAPAPAETPAPAKPSGPPSKSKAEPEPEPEPEPEASDALPSAVTQEQAWEYVCDHKGSSTDADVEEAWITAANEVGGDTDEDNFTEEMWAAVRDRALKSLA